MYRIKSLEAQLKKERIQKKNEPVDGKERMRFELDAIFMKVKLLFKSLVEGKNKAIDGALGRARTVEAL
jgi:hypothetical protein